MSGRSFATLVSAQTLSAEHFERSSLTDSAWYRTSLPPRQIISHFLRSKFPKLAWKCLISLHFRNIFRRFSSLLVLMRYCLPFLSVHFCKRNVTVSFFNLFFFSVSLLYRLEATDESLQFTYLFALNLYCYVYQIKANFAFDSEDYVAADPYKQIQTASMLLSWVVCFHSFQISKLPLMGSFTGLKVVRKTWSFFSALAVGR